MGKIRIEKRKMQNTVSHFHEKEKDDLHVSSTESLVDETFTSDQGILLKTSLCINSPVRTTRRKKKIKKYEVVF